MTMKKTLALIVLFVFAAPGLLLARDQLDADLQKEIEKEKKIEEQQAAQAAEQKSAKPEYKRLLVSVYGGFGLSFPSGEISGDGDQQGVAGMGYTAGVGLCYRFFSLGGPSLWVEYAGKQINTERSYMGSKLESTINESTVNIMLGWRFILVRMLYLEPGLYYGIRVGTWTEKITYQGDEDVNNVPDEWTRDDAGVYLGIGVMFDVTSFMSIDVGLRMETSFLYSYVHDDSLRSNLLLLNVGATFKML